MKGLLSVSVSVLLLCVLCSDSQPVNTAGDLGEVIELLQGMNEPEGRDPELMGSSEVLWSDTENLEKRGLPRLGVLVHRASPSRVRSSKYLGSSRYRLSSPAKWMSSLQG